MKYLKYEVSNSWGWVDQVVGKLTACMLESEIYLWRCQTDFSSSMSIIRRVDGEIVWNH